MSIEVRLGRWRTRKNQIAIVQEHDGRSAWPWRGHIAGCAMSWAADGRFMSQRHWNDLVEYLGPEEPQATS